MLWRRRIAACIFFLMIRRPPRSTLDRSSAASDVYKRQDHGLVSARGERVGQPQFEVRERHRVAVELDALGLSLIHISEPTRPY